MAFNGNEGEFVSLSDAGNWTKNYRDAHAGATKAHFFGRNKLEEILAQTNCQGIRVYYAIDDAGKKELVIVGVDADEKDITANNLVLDRSFPCPSHCDMLSPLND